MKSKKIFLNQKEHPELMRPGNSRNQFIILMKQMEEMERVQRAILQVLVESLPEKKQKSVLYKIKDLLDDGKLNDSVE